MYGFANINYQGPPAGGGATLITGADNGLSISTADPTKIVLGQDMGDAGNPAALLSTREIPMAGFNIQMTSSVPNVFTILQDGFLIFVEGDEAAGFPAWLELQNTADFIFKRTRKETADGWFDQVGNQVSGLSINVNYNDDSTMQIQMPDGKSFSIVDIQFPTLKLDYNTAALTLQGDTTLLTPVLPTFTMSAVGDAAQIVLSLNTGNDAGVITAPFLNLANFVFVGNGTTKATARLHLAAGTATAGQAPLKFTSGTLQTTPEAGAMEFNGTNYFLSRGLSTREFIVAGVSTSAPTPTAGTGIANFYGSSATNFLGTPTGWILGNFNGVGGRIPFY